MKIRIVPYKRSSAAWNLALEEALFLRAKQKLLEGKEVEPIIKLYSFSKPSVVLGYMQKISEIDHGYCSQAGVEVTMRTTGGGSVYLGRNDLQYSLILPQGHSLELLKTINENLVKAFQEIGFSPNITQKTGHPVIRLKNRGFIFDAQRRFKSLVLHHGTALIDNHDYEHMPRALRATKKEQEILKKGNIWLTEEANVRENDLIKALEKHLPTSSVIKKDYTQEEIKLAKVLYKNFYTNYKEISSGKKDYGICYKTDSPYNMEQYVKEDK